MAQCIPTQNESFDLFLSCLVWSLLVGCFRAKFDLFLSETSAVWYITFGTEWSSLRAKYDWFLSLRLALYHFWTRWSSLRAKFGWFLSETVWYYHFWRGWFSFEQSSTDFSLRRSLFAISLWNAVVFCFQFCFFCLFVFLLRVGHWPEQTVVVEEEGPRQPQQELVPSVGSVGGTLQGERREITLFLSDSVWQQTQRITVGGWRWSRDETAKGKAPKWNSIVEVENAGKKKNAKPPKMCKTLDRRCAKHARRRRNIHSGSDCWPKPVMITRCRGDSVKAR